MPHMLHRPNSTCVHIHSLHIHSLHIHSLRMLVCKMAATSNTAIDGDIEAS